MIFKFLFPIILQTLVLNNTVCQQTVSIQRLPFQVYLPKRGSIHNKQLQYDNHSVSVIFLSCQMFDVVFKLFQAVPLALSITSFHKNKMISVNSYLFSNYFQHVTFGALAVSAKNTCNNCIFPFLFLFSYFFFGRGGGPTNSCHSKFRETPKPFREGKSQ